MLPWHEFPKEKQHPKKTASKKTSIPPKNKQAFKSRPFRKKNKKHKSGDASGISPRGKGSKMPWRRSAVDTTRSPRQLATLTEPAHGGFPTTTRGWWWVLLVASPHEMICRDMLMTKKQNHLGTREWIFLFGSIYSKVFPLPVCSWWGELLYIHYNCKL